MPMRENRKRKLGIKKFHFLRISTVIFSNYSIRILFSKIKIEREVLSFLKNLIVITSVAKQLLLVANVKEP